MGKSKLEEAHKELEETVENKEKSRLSKSLDTLRARFGLGPSNNSNDNEELNKAKSESMPGNDGFPNDQGAETRISHARGKSKPAKHPDGNYEDLPEAENDTTDYENSEEDVLDHFEGKKVTEKSFSGMTSEEDFYKSVIESDEDGEIVAAINATDALEHLTTVMGKSVAAVSKQSAALGTYTTGQFVELNKSLAVLAEAVGVILETLEKSASAFPLPVEEDSPPSETVTEGAAEVKSTAGQAEGTDTSKSQESQPLSDDQRKYQKTLEWLQKASPTNMPSYFSAMNGQAGMEKSTQVERNSPEDLNTLHGKKRVRSAITTLIKSQGLSPDYLGLLDYRLPSEVISGVPSQYREELKRLLA